MAKYRVEFDEKNIVSMNETEETVPKNDTFLEKHTGETIWAIIDADSDEEAREKAQRLQTELQTRKTKEQITGNNKKEG